MYDIIGKGSQNNDFVQNKTVISYKNSASEGNESLLSKCRAQPVLFKKNILTFQPGKRLRTGGKYRPDRYEKSCAQIRTVVLVYVIMCVDLYYNVCGLMR